MKKFKVIEKSRFLGDETMQNVRGGGCGIAWYEACGMVAYETCDDRPGHVTCNTVEIYRTGGLCHSTGVPYYDEFCTQDKGYNGCGNYSGPIIF